MTLEITPSLSEFEEMAQRGNLIPVFQEFLADTDTPVSAYLKIREGGESFSYLLESADGGKHWGRYSFIGYDPLMTAVYRKGAVEVFHRGEVKVYDKVKNPLLVIRHLCKTFKAVTHEDLPPFQGGFVGYFNYDLIRTWEHLPRIIHEETDQGEAVFTVARRLIIFDHFTHTIKIVAFAFLDGIDGPELAYAEAKKAVAEAAKAFQRPLSLGVKNQPFSLSQLSSNFQKDEFEKAVRQAKEYIFAGDVIQVVLSQKFSGTVSGDDFVLYRYLRSLNPSPYMFYLHFGDTRLIGASPEILVRLTDGKIEVRPIAGTRPRGLYAEEDEAFESELMADPKERAEHIMLVDLGRNDVGKVAAPGSVKVSRLMEVERYSHVMHIVSRVEGILHDPYDCFDLFMSAFPAGTVSGAPKIRAMEIITELEPGGRGPYAGAVGYFGFTGNMDFCITIRTMAISGGILSVQAGAGIVADSSPEGEYEETMKKAAAMFKALEQATQRG
jgi:anthranilate synthase component 1